MDHRADPIDGGAWQRVVTAAAALAERARKFFERQPAGLAPTPVIPSEGAGTLPALEVRTITIEKRVAALADEVIASFDVVRAITEQHSQLVRTVDALIERTRLLRRCCMALAAGLVAVALLAILGWMR